MYVSLVKGNFKRKFKNEKLVKDKEFFLFHYTFIKGFEGEKNLFFFASPWNPQCG